MPNQPIHNLVQAYDIKPLDLFVLEQDGTPKKLEGQTLINYLVAYADGHGGIKSIEYVSTSGLVDTYAITLADLTVSNFTVTNGAEGGYYTIAISQPSDDQAQIVFTPSKSTMASIESYTLELPRGPMGHSGVYYGSGDVPKDFTVQIDPEGDADNEAFIASLVSEVLAELPVWTPGTY